MKHHGSPLSLKVASPGGAVSDAWRSVVPPWFFAVAVLLVVAAGSSVAAPAFYVAPDGNDAWSGTNLAPNWRRTDGPLATVKAAVSRAREWKRREGTGTLVAPTIYVRGGTYYLAEPIVLTPEDSGLQLLAYRNEQPVISGGRKLNGWEEATVNGRKLWRTQVPALPQGKMFFRELWVNGRRAVRARHPNHGYLPIAEVLDKSSTWTQGHSRFRVRAEDLPDWSTLTNAEALVMTRWVESRLPIAKVDAAKHVLYFSKRSVYELSPGDVYYIEGAFDALDEPGEWCLDQSSGTVYYLPRPGEKVARVEAVAPVLTQVLRVEGEPETSKFVNRVILWGLTFSHTEWCFPAGFDTAKDKPQIWPEPNLQVGGFGQAAVAVPGAVWGRGLRSCAFERCRFVHLGTYGLELAGGCQSNRVLSCEFGDLGAGGLKLGETRIRSNEPERTANNEISDCHFHDGGLMFHSAVGIWLGQTPGNRLTHNLIHDFYYTGISVGWTWGYGPALASNNVVAFNHVHHIGVKSDGDGPILSDMGGIYTLGMQPGTRVLNNLWHDIAGIKYGGWGIYFDEGSSSILAASNVVYRTTHGGFHQHYGATNQVWNNVFAFARDHQVQRTRAEPHPSFSFMTNIVYFDQGVLLGGNWSGDNYVMDWNLYWDARPGAKPDEMKFAGAPLPAWRERNHDLHSIIEDPKFVQPEKNNFSLKADSPASQIGFHPIDLKGVGPRGGR